MCLIDWLELLQIRFHLSWVWVKHSTCSNKHRAQKAPLGETLLEELSPHCPLHLWPGLRALPPPKSSP